MGNLKLPEGSSEIKLKDLIPEKAVTHVTEIIQAVGVGTIEKTDMRKALVDALEPYANELVAKNTNAGFVADAILYACMKGAIDQKKGS